MIDTATKGEKLFYFDLSVSDPSCKIIACTFERYCIDSDCPYCVIVFKNGKLEEEMDIEKTNLFRSKREAIREKNKILNRTIRACKKQIAICEKALSKFEKSKDKLKTL